MAKLRAQSITNGPHVVIKILADNFRDILSGNPAKIRSTEITGCRGKGTPIDQIYKYNNGGGFKVVNGEVIVKNRWSRVPFVIKSDLTPNPFYPVGLGFQQVDPEPPKDNTEAAFLERLGLDNFDEAELVPIDHAIVNRSRKNRDFDAYEYFIIIRDGRDGRIGIIDPKIVHDSSKDD